MSKRRGRTRAPATTRDSGASVAVFALAAVLAGTGLAVDTGAGAAFDAPKRLIALVGIAVAAAALLVARPRASPTDSPRPPRWARLALVLAAAALALALLSALVSPRRAIAIDASRPVLLIAALLPLGASRAVAGGRRWLAGTFLAACVLNAVVSVLQNRGLFRPFALEIVGGRQDTGAYAGNVGYLAIVLALGSVLALGLLLETRRAGMRAAAGAALLLFAMALVVNQNLTAMTSLLAGAGALLVLVFRRRAALPMLAAILAAALAVAFYPPMRFRAREISHAARSGNWDALVSFRGGAWAAALEMTRERPLTGFGPGTFGAEYVPHRLAAEIRYRRRFVAPLLTSSYAETHCDYLQVFSDAGVPAALLAFGAAGCLAAAVGRKAWRDGDPEAVVLFAILVTGAAAALTWFPLQRPITAVPLLLAAGRAWRVSAALPAEAPAA